MRRETLRRSPRPAGGSSPAMAALRRLRDPAPWMCLSVMPDLVVMGEGGEGEPAGWPFTPLWESPHQSVNGQTSQQPTGRRCRNSDACRSDVEAPQIILI